MEVVEKVYKVGTPSKTPIRADSNRASHGRKLKVVEAASTTNPKKGHAGKRKTKIAVYLIDQPTGGKTCLLHGPGYSMEDCKLLKKYSSKYAAQQPHHEK